MIVKILAGLTCLLLLGALAGGAELRAEPEKNGVEGRLLSAEGTPLPEAVILFFDATHGPPPKPDSYWRLPDIGRPVDKHGHFQVELPPGPNWYGAITPPRGGPGTQPKRENWLYLGRDAQGALATVRVEAGQITVMADLVSSGPLPAAGEEAEVVPLSGTVKEGSGKGISGFVVEAFSIPEKKERPLFSSGPLGEEGSFSFTLTPGEYELRLRPLPLQESAPRYRLTEPAIIKAVAGQALNQMELRVLIVPE